MANKDERHVEQLVAALETFSHATTPLGWKKYAERRRAVIDYLVASEHRAVRAERALAALSCVVDETTDRLIAMRERTQPTEGQDDA